MILKHQSLCFSGHFFFIVKKNLFGFKGLKSICRKQIKQKIRNYPNDIVKLNTISKILQAYLTFYNPFIKVDVAENII